MFECWRLFRHDACHAPAHVGHLLSHVDVVLAGGEADGPDLVAEGERLGQDDDGDVMLSCQKTGLMMTPIVTVILVTRLKSARNLDFLHSSKFVILGV